MGIESRDEFLEKMIRKYDEWMTDGKIPVSSKIIPVNESLNDLEWVLPTNQAINILRNSRAVALQDCICRTKYQRCENPVNVCFVTNDFADMMVSKGRAVYVTINEAIEKLRLANERGLVHLTLYNPEQHVYALCSCCDCCCHHLQIMKMYKRPDLVAHSDYIAEVDACKCVNCGQCVERCVFGAQVKKDQEETVVEYHPEYCFGCGLCKTTCPTDAISLKLRR